MIKTILIILLLPFVYWTVEDIVGVDFKRFAAEKLFYEEESS